MNESFTNEENSQSRRIVARVRTLERRQKWNCKRPFFCIHLQQLL